MPGGTLEVKDSIVVLAASICGVQKKFSGSDSGMM